MSSSSTRLPTPEGRGQLANSSALKEETRMAHTRGTTQGGPDDARIIEEHRIAGRHDDRFSRDCGRRAAIFVRLIGRLSALAAVRGSPLAPTRRWSKARPICSRSRRSRTCA
jgi:hypothetical protein